MAATTTYMSWTEVKPRDGGAWLRYDHVVPDSDCSGEITMVDQFDTAIGFATEQLEYYLPFIALDMEAERLPELLVRVRVWEEEDTTSDPVALVQATAEDLEKARLANVCQAISRAEQEARSAYGALYRQVLRSRDAGMPPGEIADAVSSRLDADSCYRLFNAHHLVQQVQHRLAEAGCRRAYARIADYATGTVHVGLDFHPDELVHEDEPSGPSPIVLDDYPGSDAKVHSRALQDAQALLNALVDRYDVLTPRGDPAAAAFLAPEPLIYDEAVICDRYPNRLQLHRPRIAAAPKPSAVVAASCRRSNCVTAHTS